MHQQSASSRRRPRVRGALRSLLLVVVLLATATPTAAAATGPLAEPMAVAGAQSAAPQALGRALRAGGTGVAVADGDVATAPGPADVTELVRIGRADPAGGSAALRATALAAEAAGQDGLLVARPLAADEGTGSSQGSSGGAIGTAVGVPLILGPIGNGFDIGDLDGDGRDDVVVLDASGDVGASGVALVARRGVDGDVLWIAEQPAEIAGAVLQAIPDADGDGRRDVLATVVTARSLAGSGGCDGSTCTDTFEETMTSQVSVLSGATGTTRWTDRVEGAIRSEFRTDVDTGEESFATSAVNVPLLHLPAGDVAGDGGLDLLSPRSSVAASSSRTTEGTFPGPQTTTESQSFSASSRLLVLDAGTGRVVDERAEPDTTSVLTAVPVPDVDGDGRSDGLGTRTFGASGRGTCTSLVVELLCDDTTTPGRTEITLLSGDGLAPSWTHRTDDPSVIASAPADLTGDGAVDVLVARRFLFDPAQRSLEVLDVDGGAVLWTHDAPDQADRSFAVESVLATTPVDEVAGHDVLLQRVEFTFEDDGTATQTTTLDRLAGESGRSLLQTQTAQDGDTFGAGILTADADGDGTADVVRTAFELEESADGGATERVVLHVESGRTGQVLLEQEGVDLLFASVLGDVDGDGGAELALPRTDPTGPGGLAVIALDGGTTRWTVPAAAESLALAQPVGDLDGAGDGRDLLVQTVVPLGQRLLLQTAARAGADGRLLWSDPDAVQVRRVSGPDRIATAAALSQDARDHADVVVLARADAWPDAIGGGPLAATLGGSLLLTARDVLSPATAAEVDRLGATRAVLLGGVAALTPQVEADLRARGLAVDRIDGVDRFATAAGIARALHDAGGDTTQVALVRGASADPEQGWTDAVVAAAAGAAAGRPVLLAGPQGLPPATRDVLAEVGAVRATVLGGPAAVSVEAEQALRDAGLATTRLSGRDRFATAALVAGLAVDDGADPSTVYVATGRRFPDALAASAVTGSGGLLLLADGTTDRADDLLGVVGTQRDRVDQLVLIGGDRALGSALESRLRALLGG